MDGTHGVCRKGQSSGDGTAPGHPRIHPCVDAAERDCRSGYGRSRPLPAVFTRWRDSAFVCAAAAGSAPTASALPGLEAALAAAMASTGDEAGCSAEELSHWRNEDGLTAFACAARAGANKEVVKALLEADIDASVPGDRTGASAGALAARAGHRRTADVLYRAATKAAMRVQGLFRGVRSMLVVGTSGARAGRPFLPVDFVNDVMDCCAPPAACGVAEPPAPPAATAAVGASVLAAAPAPAEGLVVADYLVEGECVD